jgi:hypothetical protein
MSKGFAYRTNELDFPFAVGALAAECLELLYIKLNFKVGKNK